MKSTKKSLLMSVLSLVLCFAMLLGTTYAWFTDSVTSGVNKIQAGNLDIEVTHSNAKVAASENKSIATETAMFPDKDGNAMLWEPGAMSYENFTVKNVGNLALKYNMAMNVVDFNAVTGTNDNLKDALKVMVLTDNIMENPTREAVAALDWDSADVKTLEQFKKDGGKLYPEGTADQNSSEAFQVIVYWQPTDHDNDWNLQNGKTSTDGQPLFIDFGVTVVATQLEHESDSFDNLYDASAQAPNVVMPSWSGKSAAAALSSGSATTYAITQNSKIKASVTVPANANVTYENGSMVGTDDEFALVVEPGTNTSNGVTIGTGNSITTFDVSLENVITHEKVVSNEAMKVTLDVGFIDLVRFYHKGTEYTDKVNNTDDVTAVGKFYYDTTTGIVTFMTKDFSPFSAVYKFAGGLGTEARPYLIANRDQMQAITTEYAAYKYYKVADGVTTMDCTNWTPVKLHGSFDGNGIRLANLDLGLFGTVDGTASVIKNMDITANMNRTGGIGAVVYNSNTLNLTIENVDVHGTITGATWVTPYVEFGPGPSYTWSVTFINCVSDAALTATSGSASGFVGHPYDDVSNGSVNGGSLITVIDSAFVGDMSATGTKFASGGFKYFTINGNDNRVKTRYSEEFIEKLGFNPEGTLYNTVKENASYPITSGEDGSKTFFAGNYGKNGADYYVHAGHLALLDNTPKATVPAKGEVFTVTKVADAVKAKASLQISPNDADNFGSYTGTYLTEEIELTEASTFTTNQVINFNIKINDGATVTGAVGDTFHVVGNAYGKNAHNGAVVFITQYDVNGNVLNTTRLTIAEKNLAE